MLLNKINLLDSGHVALISSSNVGVRLKELADEFFLADLHDSFLDIATLTIYVKCPLFVQLYLSRYDLKIITVQPKSEELQAYKPDLTDVGAPDRLDSEAIADDINRTTEALLINPKAYQADGCDRFTSQVIMPISVYTELIVHGSLRAFLDLLKDQPRPKAIAVYKDAINDIVVAEWNQLPQVKTLQREQDGKESN